MDAMARRLLASAAVLAGIVVTGGCGGGPTGPTESATPTPNGTVTVSEITEPLQTFTATPSTIVEGEEFVLAWQGKSGVVAVSIKGGSPFIMGRPSTASYTLRSGAEGYPSGVGTITYQATNSDVAKRLEVTVTVNPKATSAPASTPTPAPTPAPNRPPTVTVTSSASTCHPKSPSSPCSVTCTATAGDPDGDTLSYAWSGCTSGTASTASCSIADLKAHSCTVSVSDGRGGTAGASATVTGTNQAPQPDGAYYYPNDAWWEAWVYANRADAFVKQMIRNDESDDPTTCTVSGSCADLHDGLDCSAAFTSGAAGTSCSVQIRVRDGWGAGFTQTYTVTVH